MKFGILDESILKKIGRKYGLKEKNYKDYLRNEIKKEQRLFLVQSAG